MASGTSQDANTALEAQISALEADGGDQFDIVRFQFIRSMATRAQQLYEAVATIVASKALAALETYQADRTREHHRVSAIVDQAGAQQTAAKRTSHRFGNCSRKYLAKRCRWITGIGNTVTAEALD